MIQLSGMHILMHERGSNKYYMYIILYSPLHLNIMILEYVAQNLSFTVPLYSYDIASAKPYSDC